MLNFIKSLSIQQKQLFLLAVDVVAVPLAYLFSFVIQFNTVELVIPITRILPFVPLLCALAAGISLVLGIPKMRLNAYDLSGVQKTAVFGVAMTAASFLMTQVAGRAFPFGVHVLFGVMCFLLAFGIRFVMLKVVLELYRNSQPRCRVLIYGAGTTGMQLASALKSHKSIEPVAFVDDNIAMQGMTVAGLKVHRPNRISEIARERNIDRVLLAMPSLSQPKQSQIARRLQKLGLEVQALPSFAQLIGEEALVDKLSPVLPHRLLGRARLDHEMLGGAEAYAGKSVLVSGAGGSIGSELCRQIMACRPKRIVLFELSELALYTVDQDLRPMAEEAGTELVALLGSVTDQRIVRRILTDHRIDVVLHAAAYKHVPLVELNSLVGMANNVLGTATIAREAREVGVSRFILVSSDKAVRPTNVMGASKRLAELVVQDLAARSPLTAFAMVRFGNVLGSSGSVVPLFQEQIARGGPVTLTHPDVTRYFMTVQEAARLVLLAGSYARGGEVYVLDMGQPVLIRTLARQVIEASGYTVRDEANPDGDIEIETVGLRDGEKLHEELMIGEGLLTTPHPKILCAQEERLSEIEVASALRALRAAVAVGDVDAARAVADRWVEGYQPSRAQERNTGPAE